MQLKRTNHIAFSAIIIGVLLIFHQPLRAQDNSLKIGLSPGVASGPSNEGFGLQYELGYQQSIWNDRFRINPSFSIGHYRPPFFFSDTRNQYFNSRSLKFKLYYDLLKAPTWSFMVGSGLALNSTRGILGTGGMPVNGVSNNNSEYINQYGIGFIFSAGFRPNKEAKKLTWNFLPFNAIIGPNYYLEYHVKLEVEIKL